MEVEVTNLPAFRGDFEESFWRNNHAIGNKCLTMKHVLPCLMLLVFGIIISILIFILEQLPCMNKKSFITIASETTPRATITDKDINHTSMVVAEIQESLNYE